MEKPDYDFWEKQPRYTLSEAAYLCCDFEPEPEPEQEQFPRDTRQKVCAMAERLLREVEFCVTGGSSIRLVRILPSHGDDVDSKLFRRGTPGKRLFKREDLRSWAIKTEQRQLMPFLFPEERVQDNTKESQLRSDSKEALLYIIGLLAHVVVKQRGGNDLGTNDKPNQSGIATALMQQAKELCASTQGLSPTHLSERLKEAFQEVKNRVTK